MLFNDIECISRKIQETNQFIQNTNLIVLEVGYWNALKKGYSYVYNTAKLFFGKEPAAPAKFSIAANDTDMRIKQFKHNTNSLIDTRKYTFRITIIIIRLTLIIIVVVITIIFLPTMSCQQKPYF